MYGSRANQSPDAFISFGATAHLSDLKPIHYVASHCLKIHITLFLLLINYLDKQGAPSNFTPFHLEDPDDTIRSIFRSK